MRAPLGYLLGVAVCCACTVTAAAAETPLGLQLRLRGTSFSPNGDGRKDTLRGEVVLGEPATVTVEVHSSLGRRAAVLLEQAALPPGTARIRWDGTTSTGAVVRDGVYTLTASAVTDTGATAEATGRAVLSTRAPRISWRLADVPVLTPKRPRLPLRIGRDPAPVQVSLFVSDQAAQPVDVLHTAWTSTPPASVQGWGRRLVSLQPGLYRLRVDAVDRAGNTTSAAPRSVLVQHPVTTRVVRRFPDAGRRVALTFDDCNSSSAWASILSTLERKRVVGTFFCPGESVSARRGLALRALRDHDVIGDHTWNHPSLVRLHLPAVRSQFLRDQWLWWRLARASPQPYLRPPYGDYNRRVLAAAGAAGYGLVVLWDVDPADWTQPGSRVIVRRVLSRVRPGSVVILHVLPQTAAALPAILRGLWARRLTPTGLNRLARLQGLVP
jgi:peptidoglycan/xylan/chitin deacetylase (PgdA/CDA1 family)